MKIIMVHGNFIALCAILLLKNINLKEENMPELEFCQIDSKSSGAYEPIEIWPSENEKGNSYGRSADIHNSYGRSANMHNTEIMMHAITEYLNALLDLQKQIKEKYEHQLIRNERIEGEPEDIDSIVFWEKSKKLLKPGANNLYYT